jgi:hypothetical protein
MADGSRPQPHLPHRLLASGSPDLPVRGRSFYIVPVVCLLIGEGSERARQALARLHPVAGLAAWSAVAVLLVRAPAIQAVQHLRHPIMTEHLKPVMSYVSEHRLAGDGVYVYYGAMPAFTYYAPSYGFEKDDYVVGFTSRREPAVHRGHRGPSRLRGSGESGSSSHNCPRLPSERAGVHLDELDRVGTRVDQLGRPASTYLYDRRTAGYQTAHSPAVDLNLPPST